MFALYSNSIPRIDKGKRKRLERRKRILFHFISFLAIRYRWLFAIGFSFLFVSFHMINTGYLTEKKEIKLNGEEKKPAERRKPLTAHMSKW